MFVPVIKWYGPFLPKSSYDGVRNELFKGLSKINGLSVADLTKLRFMKLESGHQTSFVYVEVDLLPCDEALIERFAMQDLNSKIRHVLAMALCKTGSNLDLEVKIDVGNKEQIAPTPTLG